MSAHAKKSLGQHFLTSKELAKKIVETANVSKKDTVLEIGPGKGILTEALCARAGLVIAIEKDSLMVEHLKEKLSDEIECNKLKLVHGDILSLSLRKKVLPKKYKLVANIPYYITGQIFRTFLDTLNQPSVMVLLVQKEVADRIVKDEKGSILSVSVRAYSTPIYVKTVKAGNFFPKPRVDSAILALTNISRKRFRDSKEEKRFFELIHAGFAHKRKLLIRNLDHFGNSNHLKTVFDRANVPEKARAEDLSIESWVDILRGL
jgi:16S rRNA (adenine1518-N6/adenine1519-N6)-dimethyltransferase|tara:strand:- start:5317 stop:6102 length:786 start_codon:yes stop_codon:yes gene_type:complete